MPIALNITQPSGAVAGYHVVMNSTSNFGINAPANASAVINSYVDEQHAKVGSPCLGSMQVDISPLVLNPVVAATSILDIIEKFLIEANPVFSGATQVS